MTVFLPSKIKVTGDLDVQAAVSTVLGALPEIRAFRERIVKEVPAFDVAAFDSVEEYVLALSAAQAAFQTASAPADGLKPLAAESMKLREMLLAEARA